MPANSVAQRPVVDHETANRLMALLYAESELYELPDLSVLAETWENSTLEKGIRTIYVRLFEPGGHMDNKPVDSNIYELWLDEVRAIIAEYGQTENVKIYKYLGIWTARIWYRSDGVKYPNFVKELQRYSNRYAQHSAWQGFWFNRCVNGPWRFFVGRGWVEGRYALKEGSTWDTEWCELNDPRPNPYA